MKKDIQIISEDGDARPISQFDEATALIAQAIEKNTPVETMEKLLSMRRELRAEKAKEAYDRAMASFQADCPTIKKTKEVQDRYGKVLYAYAPIESIVEQVKAQLKENGFSYSTNMELLQDGVKVCVKVTHAAGHSEETCMSVPLGQQTSVMSKSQQTAAAVTFAKRYAFCNAFGILTGDEDNDAKPAQPEKSLYAQAREKYNQEQQTEKTAETEAVDHYQDMSIGALKVELAGLMNKGIIVKDFPSMSKLTREEIIETLEAHTVNKYESD